MRYTEKGLRNRRRKRGLSDFIINAIEKLMLGVLLIIPIAVFLNAAYFGKDKVETSSNLYNFIKPPTLQQVDKKIVRQVSLESPVNPIYKEIPITKPVDTVDKIVLNPLTQYMNDFVLKDMRENALRKEQEIRRQQELRKEQESATINKKIATIKASPNNQSSGTWEECGPMQREGYDYSNAVILCRDGKKVIIPTR